MDDSDKGRAIRKEKTQGNFKSRTKRLFRHLDRQNLGYLTHSTLSSHPQFPDIAVQDLIHKADRNGDGKVSYDEFEQYLRAKEAELGVLFQEISSLKKKRSPSPDHISPQDLKFAFQKAGINITDSQLAQLIASIDRSRDGLIDYEEWRDFFTYLPKEPNIHSVFRFFMKLEDEGESESEQVQQGKMSTYLICGGVAGAVSRTFTAPLDRIRVYLQTRTRMDTFKPSLTGPPTPNLVSFSHAPPLVKSRTLSRIQRINPSILISNIHIVIRQVYQQGGNNPLTFWRGNALNCLKIIPESAIKFYIFECMKRFLQSHESFFYTIPPPRDQPRVWERFVAGGCAGFVSQICIYPLETVKTRVMSALNGPVTITPEAVTPQNSLIHTSQTSIPSLHPIQAAPSRQSHPPTMVQPPSHAMHVGPSNSSSLVIRIVSSMYREAGLRPFFRGLQPSLIGIVPFAAIDLGVYETLKSRHLQAKQRRLGKASVVRPDVLILLACGTASGAVGACTVYPLSLIRTRLQAQGTPSHPYRYSGMLDVIRRTYAREGMSGFYKGLSPALAKVMPAASVSYAVYEGMKILLGA